MFFAAFLSLVLLPTTTFTKGLEGYIKATESERLIGWDSFYPGSESGMNRSGVVGLTFMIDEFGIPFEIMVAKSSSEKFEAAAIKSLLKYRFHPATLNSEVTVSRMSKSIRFGSLTIGSRRAPKFMNNYNKFEDEIEKAEPNQKLLLKYLKNMNRARQPTGNVYGFLLGAEYKYALEFLANGEKLDWAEKVLLQPNGHFRFSSKTDTYGPLIKWQIEKGRYGDALLNYNKMMKDASLSISQLERWIQHAELNKTSEVTSRQSEVKTYLNGMTIAGMKYNLNGLKYYLNQQTSILDQEIQGVYKLRDNGEIIEMKFEIGGNNYANFELLKRGISIKDVKGVITKLKLRCDTYFLAVDLKSENLIQIPQEYGQCNLQIMGDKGTTAILSQQ